MMSQILAPNCIGSADVGYPVKLGSGVAAAAAYLSNYTPLIPSRI